MDCLIDSNAGILAVLAGITSFFFFLEKKTQWRIFNYFPPLLFIYLVPCLLSNVKLIPAKAPVYSFLKTDILPFLLVLMLLQVNIAATVKLMGRGLLVMLAGTLGVVVGAPIAYLLVKAGLDSDAWQGFGALAGSWIGGTGNMAATAVALGLDLEENTSTSYTYAILADNVIYLVWLPILLTSKHFAGWFSRLTGGNKGLAAIDKTAMEGLIPQKSDPAMRHVLYLAFFGFAMTAAAGWLANKFPEYPSGPDARAIITHDTYKILLITLGGIILSFTPASKIPGTHIFSLALVYLFVARMGATADLSQLTLSVFWFLAGAFIWILIHGAFLLAAAKWLKVDVHTAAIASAANIGGVASAPIVAAHHNPALVPMSILMALVGYAVGNPAAILAGLMCQWLS